MTTDLTSTDQAAQPLGVGSSEGLGARIRGDLVLRALGAVQYAAAVVCVWVTLRTMHPGQIEWWQAAAMGGVDAIVAAIYTRRT